MLIPLDKALAYLDALEADRQAALALSEQKAEEARLIKARQEGFRAAMDMLGGGVPVDNAGSDPEEHVHRRARRHIPQLILRELSFSGQAVSASQIAKAIDYNLEGTQTALTRLEKAGQVLRNDEGRWAIGITATARLHEHAAAGNGKYASPAGV